jgi:hypothetical protein
MTFLLDDLTLGIVCQRAIGECETMIAVHLEADELLTRRTDGRHVEKWQTLKLDGGLLLVDGEWVTMCMTDCAQCAWDVMRVR